MNNLIILACWALTAAAPVPQGGDTSKQPVVVDFAPLPTGKTDFALYDKFYTYTDGVGFEGVWHVTTETTTDVRDYYKKRLEDDEWSVQAEGKTKLIITGHKGDPPRKVEFKVDTFEYKPKGSVTPTVHRVKNKL